MNIKYLVLALSVAGVAAPLAQAQPSISISGEILLGRRPPPPPPEVVIVVNDGPAGPPEWSHHRWYQRNQEYYYYPGYDAYYRPADHTWFYQDRGQWRNGRNLPPGFRIDFDRSVTISMATSQPYLFHRQVTTRYPYNYFGTKVRLRSDNRNDRNNDRRDRDQGDRKPDRDRGNDDQGKGKGRDRN